jgi:hypothetical protein
LITNISSIIGYYPNYSRVEKGSLISSSSLYTKEYVPHNQSTQQHTPNQSSIAATFPLTTFDHTGKEEEGSIAYFRGEKRKSQILLNLI